VFLSCSDLFLTVSQGLFNCWNIKGKTRVLHYGSTRTRTNRIGSSTADGGGGGSSSSSSHYSSSSSSQMKKHPSAKLARPRSTATVIRMFIFPAICAAGAPNILIRNMPGSWSYELNKNAKSPSVLKRLHGYPIYIYIIILYIYIYIYVFYIYIYIYITCYIITCYNHGCTTKHLRFVDDPPSRKRGWQWEISLVHGRGMKRAIYVGSWLILIAFFLFHATLWWFFT